MAFDEKNHWHLRFYKPSFPTKPNEKCHAHANSNVQFQPVLRNLIFVNVKISFYHVYFFNMRIDTAYHIFTTFCIIFLFTKFSLL